MNIEYMTIKQAVEVMGRESYNAQIAWMCEETYNFWWDTYFKFNTATYPNWQTLYDLEMRLTDDPHNDGVSDPLIEGHVNGFVAVLIKDNNPSIVGYINLIIDEDEVDLVPLGGIWLSDLFVWPEFRSKGIATKLFTVAMEWVRQAPSITTKPEFLYLCCESHLVKLYERYGCIRLSTAPDEQGWEYMKIKLAAA